MAKQELSRAALTRLSWVATIVGIIVVVLVALADPLGLGQSPRIEILNIKHGHFFE